MVTYWKNKSGKGIAMILVDIYVPSVDIDYNFQLNENVTIRVIVEEVAEMIAHKEQTSWCGTPSDLLLCSMESQEILPLSATLQQCGIRNGSKLILV